jgi:hypothetical protein
MPHDDGADTGAEKMGLSREELTVFVGEANLKPLGALFDVPLTLFEVPDIDSVRYAQEKIDEFAGMLKQHGMSSPVLAYLTGGFGCKHGIADGKLRFLAAKQEGWSTLPTYLIPKDDAVLYRTIAHLHRYDLTAVAMARLVNTLRKSRSNREVAHLTGMSEERVSHNANICRLPEDILHQADQLGTPRGILIELYRLEDEARIRAAWAEIVAGRMNRAKLRTSTKKRAQPVRETVADRATKLASDLLSVVRANGAALGTGIRDEVSGTCLEIVYVLDTTGAAS